MKDKSITLSNLIAELEEQVSIDLKVKGSSNFNEYPEFLHLLISTIKSLKR